MNTLYDKKSVRQIRSKYRKNTYCSVELQRAHIFGIKECKYLELYVNSFDYEIIYKLLTSKENCICLSKSDHRLFEKYELEKVKLNKVQTILYELSYLIRKQKYRVKNVEISNYVYSEIKELLKEL